MLTARMLGQINGSVTFRSLLNNVRPWICALSSNAGSIARKDAAVITNTNDDSATPSTKPIPGRDATLNGDCSSGVYLTIHWLMMPIRECSKNIQPIAVKKVGMRTPMAIKGNTKLPPGRSVRSTSQAIGTPKNNANATDQKAKRNVFNSVL